MDTLNKTTKHSKMVFVSPKMAKEMLIENTSNRKVKPKTVEKYAKAMKANEWFANTGETIKFSVSGKLIDGQHRLLAIIKSNSSVLLEITYGLPDQAFKYIDQGAKRGAHDILYIDGVKNANNISGIIKNYHSFCSGGKSSKQTSVSLDNNAVLSFYNERPEFWQKSYSVAIGCYMGLLKTVPPSFFGAMYALLSEKNEYSAEVFFQRLGSGIGLASNSDPIKQLRDYFLKMVESKGKINRNTTYTLAIFYKSWNCYRKNKAINCLKFDTKREAFPIPM